MSNTQEETSLLLFFHNDSLPCNKLMKLIPKGKKIQYVDIEQIDNLPQEVTSVPCLVLNGKDILLGKKAFDYFNEVDDIGFIDFACKNSLTSFSSIDNPDNIESGNGFSSIDDKGMQHGIPEYSEEEQSNIDLDKLTQERLTDIPNPPKKE